MSHVVCLALGLGAGAWLSSVHIAFDRADWFGFLTAASCAAITLIAAVAFMRSA